MKKLLILLSFLIMAFGIALNADAALVDLYLDAAPNAYGSADWPAFRDAAYGSIYNGTFVSQAHSFNPANAGTLKYEAEDYLVYNFADFGKRLHAFYYIPGQTLASLDGRLQTSILYEDAGVWHDAYAEAGWETWVAPSSSVDYDGNNDGAIDGVMGSIGNAFWGASGYYFNTPEAREALAADLQYVRDHIGDTRFLVRLDGDISELRAVHIAPVPIPSAVILLGSGLLGLVGLRKKLGSVVLWLILFTTVCTSLGTVTPAQADNLADNGKVIIARPGDFVDIQYLCRLKTGEVVAASGEIPERDQRSNVFVARKEMGPLSIVAVKPDESLPDRLWPGPFDAEILERLMRKVAGMKEGEKRQAELTAEMIPSRDEQSGFGRLARVRTRPKEMKIPRDEYQVRAGKAPEVGQPFAFDPAFPGRVESVTDRDVVIQFSANPGDVIETPFGPGRIREEGKNYKVDIDAKEGSLVRTGNRIGRIVSVTDKVITVDYRHAFGYEALICDVTADRVKKAEAGREGADGK